ncbi:MAG: hypothetical protein QOI34_451 [Verrucomicrobiota bacterium]|jgi:hypothetical protein
MNGDSRSLWFAEPGSEEKTATIIREQEKYPSEVGWRRVVPGGTSSGSRIKIPIALPGTFVAQYYSNYETRDVSSPESGAFSSPCLPSTCHPSATLSGKTQPAHD